jgi:hypothetical protein
MTQNIKNPETQKIIATYSVIYKAIFHFGGIIAALIISIMGIMLLHAYRLPTTLDSAPVTHNADQHIENIIDSDQRDVYATQTSIQQIENDDIISHWNIIAYQGYILPAHTQIEGNTSLKPISYFEEKNYDINTLIDTIKKTIIQNHNTREPKNIKTLQSIEEKTTMKEFFSIGCIDTERKITNYVCNIYLTSFIDSVFDYNLEERHAELDGITKKLPESLMSERCEGMIYYIQSSSDTSIALRNTVQQSCPIELQERYDITQQLVQANQELQNKNKTSSYPTAQVNIYKLVSLQQIIMRDIKKGNIDPLTLKQYIGFLEELSKKNEIPAWFTNDATYYINNFIILPALNEKDLTSNIEKTDNIELKEKIKKVNEWNALLNKMGLISQLTNTNLIDARQGNDILDQNSSDDIQTQINNFLYSTKYQPEAVTNINGNIRQSSGKIVAQLSPYKDYNMTITLDLSSWYPSLQSINIDSQTVITKNINALIQQQEISTLSQVEEFIVKNTSIINSSNITLCDIIEESLEEMIESCTEQLIVIKKTIKENTEIRYEIGYDNKSYRLTSLRSNSSHMLDRVKEELQDIQVDEFNFADTISFIAGIPREKQQEVSIEDQTNIGDKLLVIEAIKKYLEVDPDNVGQRGGDFVIGFTINGSQFFSQYNLTTNTITNIILPDITIKGKKVAVSKFELALNDSNRRDIKSFVENPIQYIKNTYPSVQVLYQRAD